VGSDPTRGVTAEYPVSLRDEQVTVVLREDRRDETAMKTRLLVKWYILAIKMPFLTFIIIYLKKSL
jgi:hypothetical protein